MAHALHVPMFVVLNLSPSTFCDMGNGCNENLYDTAARCFSRFHACHTTLLSSGLLCRPVVADHNMLRPLVRTQGPHHCIHFVLISHRCHPVNQPPVSSQWSRLHVQWYGTYIVTVHDTAETIVFWVLREPAGCIFCSVVRSQKLKTLHTTLSQDK